MIIDDVADNEADKLVVNKDASQKPLFAAEEVKSDKGKDN